MVLYHASKEIVEFPEVRKTKYTKDFSWGFYCTNNFEQAVHRQIVARAVRSSIIMSMNQMLNYLF